jgi:hypothetical protein
VENAQIGRAYLLPNEVYQPYKGRNLPFSVILLRRDNPKNRDLCNSFVNNISDVVTLEEADPSLNIILTYWLLRTSLEGDDLTDCDKLLQNYDYARAAQILGRYGSAGSRGPVFLALQLNSGSQAPTVFLLDLTPQTTEQVAQITADWFNVVVSRSDDQAASTPAEQGTAQAASERRGRGFFAKVLRLVRRVAGGVGCNVLRNNATGVTRVSTTFTDPYLSRVQGTLTRFVHSNLVVSVVASQIGALLCPATAGLLDVNRWGRTAGPVPARAARSLSSRRVPRAYLGSC